MRVLMIGPDRSVHGGISGVVNNYYEAGLDKQVELCYIGTMKEGSKLYKLLVAIKAFFLFCGKLSWCHIVHVNIASDVSYLRKSIFIQVADFFGKKIVIHQHGGDFENFYHNQLTDRGRRKVKKVLSMGAAFLVLAPAWKEFFGTIIGEEKITVFPDAITIPTIAPKEYGRHQLLFLGRLCKEKGIGELLEVLPELKQQYPDLKLYLAGVWEDVELQKKAEALSAYVLLPGWLSGPEKARYLQQCDIFVLPSYFEGQSVSLLEAMAYQCACVASRTGGIPLMIQDRENGILVEPKNAKALKEGLQRVLDNQEMCQRLGEKARQRAQADFGMEQNMQRLLTIYRRISTNEGL